jgi:hypothetical protein
MVVSLVFYLILKHFQSLKNVGKVVKLLFMVSYYIFFVDFLSRGFTQGFKKVICKNSIS